VLSGAFPDAESPIPENAVRGSEDELSRTVLPPFCPALLLLGQSREDGGGE
jgi:hypothetical protein